MHHVLRIFGVLLITFLVASAHAEDAVSSQPTWEQLDSTQQSILAPLSDRWKELPGYQRERILATAKHYPKMTQAQKRRFSARLLKWSSLTLEQRNMARDKFRQFQNLPAGEREAIISYWRQRQEIIKKQQLEHERPSETAPEVEQPAPSSDPIANDQPNEQTSPTAVGRMH